ncbi:MAG: hypothetical protein HY581_08180 [Nitrospirae bacterium]|nr:hypothetical protein [Nitrospirota bacterium]
MGKMVLAVFFGLVIIVGMTSASLAHHAGGVEVGDLETGSVVGTPFKELPVDAEIQAIEIGNVKAWYPPTTVVDFKSRTGRPVVLKVTNTTSAEHGFFMTADAAFEAPSVLKIKLVLKPGETKYIGIPTSDLFYATTGSTFIYNCHLHPAHVGGKFVALGR